MIATLLAGGWAAAAADGARATFTVRDGRGVPVREAVITIHPARPVAGPIRFPWPNRMLQKDIAFQPGTLIVPAGSSVAFPNGDKVRHHVYSFSKAARFDLKLYGRDETRSHAFPIAGTVALGCNIHDRMKGFIKVVDTPFAAKTDANGQVSLSGLPAGAATVRVWHPLQRAREGETSYSINITPNTALNKDVTIALRPA